MDLSTVRCWQQHTTEEECSRLHRYRRANPSFYRTGLPRGREEELRQAPPRPACRPASSGMGVYALCQREDWGAQRGCLLAGEDHGKVASCREEGVFANLFSFFRSGNIGAASKAGCPAAGPTSASLAQKSRTTNQSSPAFLKADQLSRALRIGRFWPPPGGESRDKFAHKKIKQHRAADCRHSANSEC